MFPRQYFGSCTVVLETVVRNQEAKIVVGDRTKRSDSWLAKGYGFEFVALRLVKPGYNIIFVCVRLCQGDMFSCCIKCMVPQTFCIYLCT